MVLRGDSMSMRAALEKVIGTVRKPRPTAKNVRSLGSTYTRDEEVEHCLLSKIESGGCGNCKLHERANAGVSALIDFSSFFYRGSSSPLLHRQH